MLHIPSLALDPSGKLGIFGVRGRDVAVAMDASVLTEFVESLLPCTRVTVPDKANVLYRLRDSYKGSHEEVDEH